MEADDPHPAKFLTADRLQHPVLKVVLKPVAREREDLRASLLWHADVVASTAARDQEFLDQLRAVLQAEA